MSLNAQSLNSQGWSSPCLSDASAKQFKHAPPSTFKHTHVVDLATAGVYGLEQLVHLVVAHLFAQVRED